VTNSNQYGITTGSYTAEWLELTANGRTATSEEASPAARLRARFQLAIGQIEPFNRLYEQYKDSRVPAPSVMVDFILENGVAQELARECVDTFIVNAKYLGLLQSLAGAERLLTLEHVEDDIRQEASSGDARLIPPAESTDAPAAARPRTLAVVTVATETPLDKVCFYIAPIGEEDSIERKHSDLFMGSLVEPALQEFDLELVRADAIGKPGVISAQMIEHIALAPLVISDLSFHNPNVFYELALRHAVRKPIVQLIRAADRLPFDLSQFRTIVIDTTDIYSLVPQIETYRAEIASQIRRTLAESDQTENPLSIFYPAFWSVLSLAATSEGE
jgi:hypothetical protein